MTDNGYCANYEWGARPYLADNTIWRADWRDLLGALPSGSVDLVLTDPPYGVTYAEWDTRLDVGEWWAQVRRALSPMEVEAVV